MTVTEAQILHKPVIITRYVTSAEQLHEGVDGFICEQGVDGIVEGIQFLIDHPELRDRFLSNEEKTCYESIEGIQTILGQQP